MNAGSCMPVLKGVFTMAPFIHNVPVMSALLSVSAEIHPRLKKTQEDPVCHMTGLKTSKKVSIKENKAKYTS